MNVQELICYEDEYVLIANKPSGLLTVPGKQTVYSLTTLLKDHGYACNPVHRLDMSTSGLVLFSKDATTTAILSKSFIQRQPKKMYQAIVQGQITNHFGALDYPLSKDMKRSATLSAPVQQVDFAHGKKALTFFQVIAYEPQRQVTYLHLFPQTGRTHQLRVHLSYFGHAIIGDQLYASPTASTLCLHAAYLEFPHPYLKKQVSCYRQALFWDLD